MGFEAQNPEAISAKPEEQLGGNLDIAIIRRAPSRDAYKFSPVAEKLRFLQA